MDELTAFLSARLDEDEAAARLATSGPWVVGRTVSKDGEHYGSHVAAMGEEKRMLLDMNSGYTRSKHVETAEHIARHDPARVLRDVGADRSLLAEWQKAETDPAVDDQWNAGLAAGLRVAVQIRAGRHSDHPDYRPEWKP